MRARLIHVGVDAVLDLDVTDLVGAVGTREIARRAGVASSTFFEHFATMQIYTDALVDHVYNISAAAERTDVPVNLGAVAGSDQALSAVFALHRADFLRIRHDPEFRVRVGLWALGGSSMDQVFGRYLAELDDRLIAAAEALIASWGRELRPPFDAAGYVAVQVALVQGAALRSITDPDRLPIELFERAAASLPVVALRRVGDRLSADDRLAEVNYYTLRGQRTREPATERDGQTAARILRAASDLFETHGFESTTIAAIARAADVHVDTVYSHFQSKPAIATRVFQSALVGGPPPALDLTPLDQLSGLLERLAVRTGAHPDLAGQYAISVLNIEPTDDHLLAAMLGLITEATRAGELSDRCDAAHLARTLVLSVTSQTLCHRATPPQEVVSATLAMCARQPAPDEGTEPPGPDPAAAPG